MKARFLSWLPSVRQTSFHIERCDLKHRAAERVHEDGERANAEEGGFYPHLQSSRLLRIRVLLNTTTSEYNTPIWFAVLDLIF